MTPGAILTLGLGLYSDINHLVTLGYGTGAEPPPPAPEPTPAAAEERFAGGYTTSVGERRRARKEVSEARSRFGIQDAEALLAIQEVARRQAERLEMDRQKQYDEMVRELELRRIEYRASYLEALAAERERLITEEIKRRFQMQDDEAVILLTLIAAAAGVC